MVRSGSRPARSNSLGNKDPGKEMKVPKEMKFADDLWVVLKPAPDITGMWVSHCLDLDLMSQGDSPDHAFKMMIEALSLTIAEDLIAGLDPKRRGAQTPAEDWEEQARVARDGHRVEFAQLKNEKAIVAVNLKFALEVVTKKHAAQQRTLNIEAGPPAWQIAAASFRQRASTT
jgi:hypothetical protein